MNKNLVLFKAALLKSLNSGNRFRLPLGLTAILTVIPPLLFVAGTMQLFNLVTSSLLQGNIIAFITTPLGFFSLLVLLLLFILTLIVISMSVKTQIRLVIAISQGGKAKLLPALCGGSSILTYTAVFVSYLMFTLSGFTLFVIPGLILGSLFIFALFYAADQRLSSIAAFTSSLRLLRGKLFAVLPFFVLFISGCCLVCAAAVLAVLFLPLIPAICISGLCLLIYFFVISPTASCFLAEIYLRNDITS